MCMKVGAGFIDDAHRLNRRFFWHKQWRTDGDA